MTNSETAQKAFKLFSQGWATGNFSEYIEMLADEMIFWFPTGVHKGQYTGVAGKQQMLAKCHDDAKSGDKLTFSDPHYILSDGNSTLFEFQSSGIANGQSYDGHNAIAFQVDDGKVIGYREYFGTCEACVNT